MKYLILIFLILFSLNLLAEVVNEQRIAQSGKKSRSSARQEIINKVIDMVSLEYTQGLIGTDKTQRNLTVIKNKIIRNSGKYISYIKGTNLRQEDGKYLMDVSLRLSTDDLKSILLSKGLLYELDGPPKILLMVNLLDKVQLKNFAWWSSQEESSLKKHAVLVNTIFFDQMKEKGFYSYSPIKRKFFYSLPDQYRTENLMLQDALFVGDFFKSQVVVRGNLSVSQSREIEKYNIQISLDGIQTVNSRTIAHLSRSFTTERGNLESVVRSSISKNFPKVASAFTEQLHSAWKKGVFGSDLLRISLKGRYNYEEYIKIKETLSNIQLIKSLHERVFSPEKIVFEIDASVGVRQIGQTLERSSRNQVKFKVDDYGQKSIAVRAKVL